MLNYFCLGCLLLSAGTIYSQVNEKTIIAAGADFYSTYIFRGSKYGTGPAIQPTIKINAGWITAGAWGSVDFTGYQEADLYFSFSLPAGFNIGLTDYYFPDLAYFDYTRETGSHAYELNAGYTIQSLALSANYILNEAGGAASSGEDLYFQAGYTFPGFSLIAGAGNGWHTSDGRFNVCNISFVTSGKVVITEKFTIPITGQLILNPERENLYILFGLTLLTL